jgi:uncharacterized protein
MQLCHRHPEALCQMLASFRVRNYRSFLLEQEFSLWGERRGHDPNGRPQPLTVGAIYGANASGKSNLLRAMAFGRNAVLGSHRRWKPDGGVRGRVPFLLADAARAEPTLVEYELLLDGTRYQYGFECTDVAFVREWLYAYPRGKRQTWYEHDTTERDPWYFSRQFQGPNRLVASTTRSNALFLSTAAAVGHPGISAVYDWFSGHLSPVANSDSRLELMSYSLGVLNDAEHPDRRERLLDLVRAADLGIVDGRVKAREFSETERDRIVRVLRALGDADNEVEDGDASEALEAASRYIEFSHASDGGESVPLAAESESFGTRALVALSGPILIALEDGDTLLVDELDASLHPRLVAEIVRLFLNPATNPKRAQLVFTTHDTSLLGNLAGRGRTLDRSLVWLVEKTRGGSSTVYPLTDFSPRQDENLERGYLQGRFGGVPVVSDTLGQPGEATPPDPAANA